MRGQQGGAHVGLSRAAPGLWATRAFAAAGQGSAGHSDESGRDATPPTQYPGFRPIQRHDPLSRTLNCTSSDSRVRSPVPSFKSGLNKPLLQDLLWARVVSNHRPLACEASALPLSYAPGSCDLQAKNTIPLPLVNPDRGPQMGWFSLDKRTGSVFVSTVIVVRPLITRGRLQAAATGALTRAPRCPIGKPRRVGRTGSPAPRSTRR